MNELLFKLKRYNIDIDVVDDRLTINVPEGFQETTLIEEVRENKKELIEYINTIRRADRIYAGISKALAKNYYRLSPPQRRLFLLHELAKDSLAYNLSQAYVIEGRPDPEKLNATFRALIARHEILRTCFVIIDSEPVQRILEEFDFQLELYSGTAAEADKICRRFTRPFDLARAPLFRAGLVTLDNGSHLLLVDMHHIVSDGTSQAVLMHDFTALYHNQKLPPLKLQYRDFSEWLRSPQLERTIASQKDFWLREFDGIPDAGELPADRPRPAVNNFKGETIRFSLPPDLTLALHRVAESTGTSLFMLLLSAYGVLLSKLSGKENVVIGTPVAGRRHADLEGLIGMFVNTLALPLHTDGRLSFRQYLSLVTSKVLACLDNQDYPYERLINDLQLNRSPGRNLLFDTVFSYQKAPAASLAAGGLRVHPYEQPKLTAKYDMTLACTEAEGALHWQVEYSTVLFNSQTIGRFIRYFTNLLEAVAADDKVLLRDIRLHSAGEEEYLLHINNNTGVDYPKDQTIVSLFERQVRLTPDRIAIELEDRQMTYRELNERANELACSLRRKGVGADTIVGLLTGRSLLTIVGMIGILKAGGAYLPIDTEYPEERIRYLLNDSKAGVLVTTSRALPAIIEAYDCVFLDQPAGPCEGASDPDPVNKPEDLCYIIYTSGTTGNPKGVMVEHRNVVRLLFNRAFPFSFGQEDVWTMFHSPCFDFSVWEMYGALLYGGKLIIVPKRDAIDPVKFFGLLRSKAVTVLNQTPTAFLNLVPVDQRLGVNLETLRYVIFGGEALSPFKLKAWRAKYPAVRLVNMFGTTETTVHVTYKEIGDAEIDGNVSNIGKPIPTLAIYLFDRHLKLVPEGVAGELCIGGAGVSRGYLYREQLTSERFVPNPYQDGETLYRTGDLARLLPDGEIVYLGRDDQQVQLKGFRIEPGEIEHHLIQHPLVSNAVVIVRENAGGHRHLCAYLTGAEDIPLEQVRSYLSGRLPGHMIPSYFMQVDGIPLTSSDKIDIGRLPEPVVADRAEYVPPSSKEEEVMAEIWSKHLAISQTGIRDNFFSLGGDSLKAIGLIASINEMLGCSLTIADLYSNQTIEELSPLVERINDREKEDLESAYRELENFDGRYRRTHDATEEYEAIYPMNGVEKGMVFHTLKKKAGERNIHNIIYHEQNIYPIPLKDFDLAIFRQALGLLIRKHPAFRKIYDLDSLAHLVKKEIEPELGYVDISGLALAWQKEFMLQKMDEEKIKTTGLSMSVLWRMSIIKVKEDFHYLLFDMHHSLMDGWSLSSFITELNNVYIRLSANREYRPEPLTCGYEDQIAGEIAAARNPASVAYWKEELRDYRRFELPRTGDEHKYVCKFFNLGKDLRKELEALALSYDTSFKHLCFAAYVYTIRMLSFSNDIVVGIVANNRPLVPDGEKLIGCFLNTVPFRCRIPAKQTWRELFGYIEEKLRVLKRHERVPFREILNITGEGSQERTPVFETSFNFVDFRVFRDMLASEQSRDVLPVDLRFENYANNNTLFDLHIFAHEQGFQLGLTYSASIITESLSERIRVYYETILQSFVRHTTGQAGKEKVFPIGERAFLLHHLDNSRVGYPDKVTLVALFEKQVSRDPGRTALVLDRQRMTYGELNNKANGIARRLRARGVGRETIVGLLMDRSIETVAGMLGILKAGGCYLPMDTDYPEDRIAYMVEDSGIGLVLTQPGYAGMLQGKCETIFVGDAADAAADIPNPEPAGKPDDLCYIIYTSGTTGRPKGVMVEHRNVVRLLFNDAFAFQFGPDDVWTMFHSHCFDFSVWEMYGALLHGGKLVIIPKMEAMNLAGYARTVLDQGVTVLNQTPSAFYSLMQEILQSPKDHSFIRYVIFGGEALTPSKLVPWRERYPRVKLINMFGITETTVHVTYKEIGDREIDQTTSAIGRPIPGMSVYLLDESRLPVPQGITGEIYVGGQGVTRGYLNNAVLTAERFIANPYREGERLYRSGDLGRMLEDGELEYLGRSDQQVQVRGFRVEPGEVEYHLLQFGPVDDAVVVVRTSGEKEKEYLCAFLVGKEPIPVKDLRTHLRKNLPAYMIPSRFIQLESIPLTSNHKADRKYLAEKPIEPYQSPEDQDQEGSRQTEEVSYEDAPDNIAVIDGMNVDLEQIERQLETIPDVTRAIVTVIHTRLRLEMGGEIVPRTELIAAIICDEDKFMPTYHYRDALRMVLPDYMIPTRCIQLNAAELPEQFGREQLNEYLRRFELTTTPGEREPNDRELVVMAVWKKILGIEKISISDVFFDIGGHSLHVVQMMNHFKQELGIELEFDDIMYMSVEQLAIKYIH